jgi:hypothetical protein
MEVLSWDGKQEWTYKLTDLILSTLHALDYQNLNAQAWVYCGCYSNDGIFEEYDESCACTSGKMYLWKVKVYDSGKPEKNNQLYPEGGKVKVSLSLTWKEWYAIQAERAFDTGTGITGLYWENNVLMFKGKVFTLPGGSHIERRKKGE